jgi:acetyl-CoA carboxylase beta subunit
MLTLEPPAVLETSFLAGVMNEAAGEVFSTMLNHAAQQDPPIVRAGCRRSS